MILPFVSLTMELTFLLEKIEQMVVLVQRASIKIFIRSFLPRSFSCILLSISAYVSVSVISKTKSNFTRALQN